MNNNGHRCESYPCYYCHREIYFSSSPPNTFMCLDKRISLQVDNLEKISKEYNNYKSDSLYSSSNMVDAEVQTTSSYISDKLAQSSIEIPKNNISTSQTQSTNTDFDLELDYEYYGETEKKMKKMNEIKQKQKEQHQKEEKNQKMINDIDEMLFSMEYSDDEKDINQNSDVLVQEFDGHIDSLPESVFYDIAEELLLRQSMEF